MIFQYIHTSKILKLKIYKINACIIDPKIPSFKIFSMKMCSKNFKINFFEILKIAILNFLECYILFQKHTLQEFQKSHFFTPLCVP